MSDRPEGPPAEREPGDATDKAETEPVTASGTEPVTAAGTEPETAAATEPVTAAGTEPPTVPEAAAEPPTLVAETPPVEVEPPATEPEGAATAEREEPVAEVTEAETPVATATPVEAQAEVGPVAEEAAPPSEQIEWRPVVTGEQIEWQPVLKSDADTAAEGRYEDPDEEWPDEEWDEEPVAARRTRAVAGNGAARRSRPAAGTRPPSRPPREAAGPPKPPPNQRRQVILLSILTAVVVIVAVLGVVLSRGAQQTGSEATTPPTTGRTSGTGTTVPATELTTFRDDVTGFTIRYPRTWNRLVPPIADIRLVLVVGQDDALSVRILPIQTPATTQNIANFKAVTDAIVFGDMNNKLVQEQLVTLNGKLTYYYLYTFKDKDTGVEGVHAHYFVFEGHRMFSMVFQAAPPEDFPRLAAVYDQVAESFTVPPEQPGTTVAPPTTR